MTEFVHLRLHTEYSLVDGLVRVKPLMARVAELDMPAVAITDVCNFYGLIKAYKAAFAAGIKPIFGADFTVLENEGADRGFSLCLLVMNDIGYRNLTRLISRAFTEGQQHGEPLVRKEWLADCAEGLIALSCGAAGDVGQALLADKHELASRRARYWMDLYPGRFYLEVHRVGRQGDETHLHAAVALAEELRCPVVATNDVRFLEASEFEAHEARVCIREGRTLDDPRRARPYTEQQHLRSPREMAELFADLPEALANSVEIARRCSLVLELGKPFLPDYPVPEGLSLDNYFRQLSHEGLDRRLERLFDSASPDFETKRATYRARLEFELDTIVQMGFPGYFLIVMDFIHWAKQHDIPVGPGRGSGAGSLVAYALEITDLDPLAYDLLFERFLNPERVSMPDFDVDFCMERRDEVIEYVADTYGRDAVSQIITFGTMAAKAVVRDVARVQGKSYGLADKLSKMIPFEVGMTLDKALQQEEPLQEFLEEDGQAQEIWDMAVQLEGVTRNVGKHAGGVVIAPSKLTDFAPLFCDEGGGSLVTQYDKGDVEEAGLVKFDFLGLRTLTIIDWAVRMIDEARRREGEQALDIAALPLDDTASFELLKSGNTTAVFQLESRGMKELIRDLKPDCFEDIVALVALYRPGPLQSGMVENFFNRKHGREAISYPDPNYQHEWLQPILEPTYGIILYQEQVMQIAQVLAGYTLGEADLLRRAMGKKQSAEMAKQRAVFEQGARSRGIDGGLAIKIFDLVEKFAGYGFNKSHSAAYALVSYQTAWLKAHYPAQFMAAVMSSELDNTDKIVVLVDECKRMDLSVRLPDVNEGQHMFTVNTGGEIIYGLGAIKGLGAGPVDNILAARREGGPFSDLFDFCGRTDPRRVNRRAIEALIRCGAFDSLGTERWVLMAALDDALRSAEQDAANRDCGMGDLFGEVLPGAAANGDVYGAFRQVRSWSDKERLGGERDTLGLYISGHPIDHYWDEVRRFAPQRIADLREDRRNNQVIVGLVMESRTMKTQRGTMAVMKLDDSTGQIEVTLFSETYSTYRELAVKDTLVIAEGRIATSDKTQKLEMRAQSLRSLEEARQSRAANLTIEVRSELVDERFTELLEKTLAGAGGGNCPVSLIYRQPHNLARIHLGRRWQVVPSDELLQELREVVGAERVFLQYQ